jgi:molybdate transport system substrate-binding protein
VIAAQLARGVAADVVILSREGLEGLIAERRIVPGTDVDLARTPIGAAVRKGAPKPDMSTLEACTRALLGAKTVAVPASTSGIFLMEVVFPRLGIAQKIEVTVTPRGTGAAAMVAAGEAKLALLPVSEILGAPGIELVGAIPEEIQLNQTFSAAVVAGSRQLGAAKQLIAFLASERAAAAIRQTGMEPLRLPSG